MKEIHNQSIESILKSNINDLVHAIVRELSMACRKAAIYGSTHPLSQKAIQKPFLLIDKIFKYKRYINFNLQNGHLYILNIRLKESVFNEEIIKYMQMLDLKAFMFEKRLTLGEMEKFMFRFVKRVDRSNHDELIASYLKAEKINSVEVNSELCYDLFEKNEQYRGDVSHDFSLRNIIMQQLPNSIEGLAKLYSSDQEYAEANFCDYDLEYVYRLVPEKVSQLSSDAIKTEIREHVKELVESQDENIRNNGVAVCKEICRLLEYHPDYENIISEIDSYMTCEDVDQEFTSDIKSPTVKIKQKVKQSIDSLMQEIFSDISVEFSPELFAENFAHLYKTGQREKAAEVATELVEYLGHASNDFRQKALSLLLETLKPLHLYSEAYLFDKLTQVIIKNLFEKKESFEYSEFIWQIIEKSLAEKDYGLLAKIMNSLHLRRRIENDVTIYDSITIKKIYMNFNQKQIIDELIDELLKSNPATTQYLKDILVGSGSEEVAVALSQIISHPNRQIRQTALKILGELGHASLDVFGRVLADDDYFEREDGRRELPDARWYVVRNAIFVFGLLKDQKGCIPLRLRINDADVRVRREIISSLEKIGGEEAVDVLMMMASDEDREIRESAVIAIGLIGTEEASPLLISLIHQNPQIALKAIIALGNVGGDDAEKYLSSILTDEELLNELKSSKFSKDEIRVATIKALGNLGDSQSIRTIKEYQENQSTTQKILFKNSPVNRTIKNILSKK